MKNEDLFINYLSLSPKYQEIHNWTEQTHQLIQQHSDYLNELGKQGTLVFAGRTLLNPGDENLFGIALIKAASLEEAQQIFAKDPAITHQIQEALILPFSMGIRHLYNIPPQVE